MYQALFLGAKKTTQTFFVQSFSTTLRVMGPRRKSWTSAPKSAFSRGPGGGEKLFDPWACGRKGRECPREIRTKKFMFMLFFSSLISDCEVPRRRVFTTPTNFTEP